jgi:hypothetical protein
MEKESIFEVADADAIFHAVILKIIDGIQDTKSLATKEEGGHFFNSLAIPQPIRADEQMSVQ